MTDYSKMNVEELEEEVSKIYDSEGRPDEYYRATIFMGQLEFAKHIYHDRNTPQTKKFSPDVRPYKNASKKAEISSFGQALMQFLLLARTRGIEFNKMFEYAVEHLKDREWGEKVAENDKEVKGLPVGEGRVLGMAYLASNENPICDAPDDCIVVMEHASADVSDHLNRVKAIVTDHGGKLSHLATVAREMGKPAIVGTGNATKLIRDGDRIVVDADQGIVIKSS